MVNFILHNDYTAIQTEDLNALQNIKDKTTLTFVNFLYRWTCMECNKIIEWRNKKPFCTTCGKAKSFREVKKKPKPNYEYLEYFKDNKFPTGLMNRVLNNFPYEYHITNSIDKRKGFPLSNNLPALRYYQTEASEIALKKYRGIIELPTRSGKTFLAVDIICKLGLQSLVIVPSIYLLHQTVKVFEESIPSKIVGIIGDSIFEPNMINIATIQTLNSRISLPVIQNILRNTEVLIIDEAHHINLEKKGNEVSESNTWMNVCMSIGGFYKFGLTATPGKYNDIERFLLEAVTGPIIYSIELDKLISEGYIAQVKVEIVEYEHLNPTWDEWKTAQKTGIVENEERNLLISKLAYEEINNGKSVFISCNQIKHAKLLLKLMPDAVYLDGNDNAESRISSITEFEKDKKILISTLFKEGADLNFDSIIIAAGYKKERDTIQRANRVLTNSKNIGKIIDIYDKDNSILEKHCKERIKTYKKQKFPIFHQ